MHSTFGPFFSCRTAEADVFLKHVMQYLLYIDKKFTIFIAEMFSDENNVHDAVVGDVGTTSVKRKHSGRRLIIFSLTFLSYSEFSN